MKLLIKLEKPIEDYEYLFGIDKQLSKNVSIKEGKLKGQKGLLYVLSVSNKDFQDDSEIKMFHALKEVRGLEILKILKFSKSFMDINDVENGKDKDKWNKTLKGIRTHKSTKPLTIKKGKLFWWIGLYDVTPKHNFDPRYILWTIYKVGFGLGLIPRDFTTALQPCSNDDMGYQTAEDGSD